MGTPTLLLLLKAITEDSNLANFPGLVPAVDAFCWIHKAISLSFPGSETIESENFLSQFILILVLCRHVCLSKLISFRPRNVYSFS